MVLKPNIVPVQGRQGVSNCNKIDNSHPHQYISFQFSDERLFLKYGGFYPFCTSWVGWKGKKELLEISAIYYVPSHKICQISQNEERQPEELI